MPRPRRVGSFSRILGPRLIRFAPSAPRSPMCWHVMRRIGRMPSVQRSSKHCDRCESGSREAECFLPFELSGGLCQRIGIAIASACSPRLLIADEPTTGLDVTTQAVIMDLIQDLARSRQLGTVLITHDLALASEYCDRIVVMHAGHIVEAAPVKELFAHPAYPASPPTPHEAVAERPSMVDSITDQAVEGSIPDLRRSDSRPAASPRTMRNDGCPDVTEASYA